MTLPVDIQFIKDEVTRLGGLPEISESVKAIYDFRGTVYVSKSGKPRDLKNRRLREWDAELSEVTDIVYIIFGSALAQGAMTIQAMCGMLNHIIKVEELIDRVNILASCIALISKTGLIDFKMSESGYYMVSTEYDLDDVPDIDRHGTAFNRPQLVEENYDSEQGSMILGGKLNFHDYDICLDHINKLNQVPMALNWRFICDYKEEPKESYFKESDPAWKTRQKTIMWDMQTAQARSKYIELMSSKGRNKCFPNHKLCTRGRTYQVGYHLNCQGSSFKKASLELYNKEKLNDS
jgi:hypothetical protein